jgi:Asp-tRNA(Asn)/Glu-tRNA(Gln) amidotransferase C subunit
MKQVEKIAKIKAEELGEKDLKKVLKMVIGSINTLQGVFIEGKKPKEFLNEWIKNIKIKNNLKNE